jgi:SAM-dependent methyltransferase
VQRSGLDGQSLPFADDSYDAALSTWTLCAIPDVTPAVAEVRRVLKPGGTLHFLENGLAPNERVRGGNAASIRWSSGNRRMPLHPARHRAADDRGARRMTLARSGPFHTLREHCNLS